MRNVRNVRNVRKMRKDGRTEGQRFRVKAENTEFLRERL